jgi:hypothetical protein
MAHDTERKEEHKQSQADIILEMGAFYDRNTIPEIYPLRGW